MPTRKLISTLWRRSISARSPVQLSAHAFPSQLGRLHQVPPQAIIEFRYQRVYPNKGTKPTTGLCRISDAYDSLSGSAFAWVHAATEDLPPPGSYPTGKKTAEVQAAMCSAGCISAICNRAAESHANHAPIAWGQRLIYFCSNPISILWSWISFPRHFVEIQSYLNKMNKPLGSYKQAWGVRLRRRETQRCLGILPPKSAT